MEVQRVLLAHFLLSTSSFHYTYHIPNIYFMFLLLLCIPQFALHKALMCPYQEKDVNCHHMCAPTAFTRAVRNNIITKEHKLGGDDSKNNFPKWICTFN